MQKQQLKENITILLRDSSQKKTPVNQLATWNIFLLEKPMVAHLPVMEPDCSLPHSQ